MAQMTLHRALAEIKLIEKRINKLIHNSVFVSVVENGKAPQGFTSAEDFVKQASANHDSVTDLIKRRDTIKAALIKANAEHKVEIVGRTMTLAEAIYLRDKGLEEHQELLEKLRRQRTNAAITMEAMAATLRERTERHVKEWFSNTERPTAAEIAEVTEQFEKRYEVKLLDPIDIDAKISEMDHFIDGFRNEVHFILGEANNSVKIDIED